MKLKDYTMFTPKAAFITKNLAVKESWKFSQLLQQLTQERVSPKETLEDSSSTWNAEGKDTEEKCSLDL